jgi:hypothetical protein
VIAVAFATSEQVIKKHPHGIFDKRGGGSLLELALYVAAHGGSDWDEPVGEELLPIADSELGVARRSR